MSFQAYLDTIEKKTGLTPAPRYIGWVTESDGRGSLPAMR